MMVGSCSGRTDPVAVRLEGVQEHQSRWASVRPATYAFTLVRQCECTPDMAGPVAVTVSGDTIVAMTYGDGTPVPRSSRRLFPTVDQLFEVIRESILSGFAVTVIYDDASGVPVSLFVDPDRDGGDDEFGYRVLSLPTAATLVGVAHLPASREVWAPGVPGAGPFRRSWLGQRRMSPWVGVRAGAVKADPVRGRIRGRISQIEVTQIEVTQTRGSYG